MGGNRQIGLNGAEVWAYVVELDDGVRMRLDLTDWERSGLSVGRRVPLRLPGKAEVSLFITHATEVPPFVWVVLAKRVRVAG